MIFFINYVSLKSKNFLMSMQIYKISTNGTFNIFKTNNNYYKPFSIYGSGIDGAIPNGTKYSIFSSIDFTGKAIPDTLFANCTEPMSDVLSRFCANLTIKVEGLSSGHLIFVEYKIFDIIPEGSY